MCVCGWVCSVRVGVSSGACCTCRCGEDGHTSPGPVPVFFFVSVFPHKLACGVGLSASVGATVWVSVHVGASDRFGRWWPGWVSWVWRGGG